MSTLRFAIGAAALGLVLAAEAHAQKPDSGAFFVRLGTDTIALERYIRSPHQLVAEGLLRTPQTRRYKLTITWKDDGTLSWYEVINDRVAGVPNSAPAMRSLATYIGDSVRIETWVNAEPRPMRAVAATADMIPLQLPFYSTYETALMQARKAATDTVTIKMIAGSTAIPYLVHWTGADSVTLYNPQGGTIRARVDQQGRLLGLTGAQTTFKVNVTRADRIDLEAYQKRYAEDEAKGISIGPLSPRDSMEAEVGETSVLVSYGRPSKRGRVIFGGVVPWGKVWRTGANAASTIEISNPIEINGVVIPAGRYSLWSIPDRTQWQIVFNKQTGQWGTVYDEKQDLARVYVAQEALPVPVETFTIRFQARTTDTAVMTLSWDRTRVIVPIRVVKE